MELGICGEEDLKNKITISIIQAEIPLDTEKAMLVTNGEVKHSMKIINASQKWDKIIHEFCQ